MPLFHTILYPTDFSEASVSAYRLACSLAEHHKCKLVIAHVLETPAAAFLGSGPLPDLGNWMKEIQVKLARLRPSDPTVAVDHVLVDGDAAGEIVRLARERNCDLIVLGTHGRSGLKRLLLGSVAEEVVRKAPCPVLTIKPREPASEVGPDVGR